MTGTLVDLYEEMRACTACCLMETCCQVVVSLGQPKSPGLLIYGDFPGQQEDSRGEPFVGQAGMLLRMVLRETGILNRTNTLVGNVVRCRPPNNKLPKGSAETCSGKWLTKEIELAKPARILLLGSVPLKQVAGLSGIMALRGQWISAHGIRTMPTFHPSYVMRQEEEGDVSARSLFESDIAEVAREVAEVLSGQE